MKNQPSVRNGKQIVTISAKGCCFPQVSEAKADMSTILLIETKSAFEELCDMGMYRFEFAP